ncbi:hypothetical protein [Paraburkholderia fungorum]|uniref:Uncharacterized protein n=1 Tax=Paraburkholderia fungorum TaxID=134537 RepID=A0A3R7L7G5_9BURK|nr:hypothetical protein [Paraburkholderia fungorum]RKF35706.1 hypothetical protein BCY88_08675 [Paraburkholderia fungorum]
MARLDRPPPGAIVDDQAAPVFHRIREHKNGTEQNRIPGLRNEQRLPGSDEAFRVATMSGKHLKNPAFLGGPTLGVLALTCQDNRIWVRAVVADRRENNPSRSMMSAKRRQNLAA